MLLRLSRAADSGGDHVLRIWDGQYFGGNARAWTAVVAPDHTIRIGANTVVSFDGDHWASHPVPGSYAVRALAFGPDGRLWVGAVGQIGYFEKSGWDFHSLTASLPPGVRLGDVWRVFPDERGVVVVTQTAVLRWQSGTWSVWPFPGARRLPASRTMGAIWFHHRPTGLWTLEKSGPVLRIPQAQLSGANGLIYVTEVGGELLFVSHGGIFRRRGAALIPWSPAGSAFVRRGDPTSVCRLPNGGIAIATLTAGIALISPDGAHVAIIDREHGLPSRTVFRVSAGLGHTLWCSMPGHVVAIDLSDQVRIYPAGRHSFNSLDALQTFEDRMYVTTDDGLLREDARGDFESVPGRIRYRDLLATPYGLLGTRATAIDLLSDRTTTAIYRTREDPICIARAGHRDEWLVADGFSIADLRRSPAGRWAADRLTILPDIAISFARASDGSIWASTAGGKLFHIEKDRSPAAVPIAIPGSSGPRSVLVSQVGGEIVALTAVGGFEHRSGAFVPIADMPRLPVLAASRPDSRGSIWVVLGSPFQTGEPAVLLGSLRRSTADALRWTLLPNACPSGIGQVRRVHGAPDGSVWVGGTKGLARIVPRDETSSAIPSAPVLHLNIPDGGSVPFGSAPVRCKIGSTEYLRHSQIRFQSELIGLDRDWTEPTDEAMLRFPGLHEGSYELRVRTVDVFGRTSPEVSARFRILPPWYRTGWTEGAGLVLAAAFVFTGMQLRHRRIARRTRELETAITAKTAELVKANAAKSEFIANMSHDIRHPVSGIVGLCVALEDSVLTAVQRQWVHSIQNCGHLLGHLVDDVLDIALIEAGQMKFDSVPFVPAELVLTCAEMMSAPAAEAGCTIRTSDDAESRHPYLGDPGRVQQIVINFLSNAFKAAPRTEIHLRVVALFEDHLRFEVADRGVGITAEDLERLFTKFTRLGGRSGVPGIGLGLALCRQIADAMSGEVGAVSTPGQGSTFFLELPLARAPAQAPAPEPYATEGGHALIVDDVDYAARAAAAVFHRLGFVATVALSPAAAVSACTSQTFDVVMIDWDIAPDTTGGQLLQLLRQYPGARKARAIAVSAHTDSNLRSACDAAGFDAFVLKPITPESLRSVLPSMAETPAAAAAVPLASVSDASTLAPAPVGSLDAFLDDSLRSLRLARTHPDIRVVHRTAHAILGCARIIDAAELSIAAVQLLRTDRIDQDALDACETELLNVRRKRASDSDPAP